jgi:hypothetical protein
MTIALIVTVVIFVFACAVFRLALLRIILNLLPVAMGTVCAAFLLDEHPNRAIVVGLVSLYVTCAWWEFLDEAVWMKIGICRDFESGAARRARHSCRTTEDRPDRPDLPGRPANR